MTISEDNLYRRRDVLGVVVSLTCLPACSESEEARRERSGLPPMTEEQKRMRKKFKGGGVKHQVQHRFIELRSWVD